MRRITCKVCGVSTIIAPGDPVQDPHEALVCGCCPDDHHHGYAAAICPGRHAGSCWQGPASGPRPKGCTVCRPVIHVYLGPAPLSFAGG